MLTRALAVSLVSGSCFAASVFAGPDCGIFVSNAGADVPGGGLSSDDPVATIGFAMTRAQQEGLACVFLQAGTYNEVVRPIDGITIDGGYDATWERMPFNFPGHLSRIQGGSDVALGHFAGVIVENAPSGVTLSNLVVTGANAMGTMSGSGLNSYGVYANGSGTVVLDLVRIECGNGADGGGGKAGADAAQSLAPSGGIGGNGGTTVTCDSSSRGSGGAPAINGLVGVSSRGGGGGLGGQADTDCGFPFDFDARPGTSGQDAVVSQNGGFGDGGGGGSSNCGPGQDGADGRVADGAPGSGGGGGSVVGGAWMSLPGDDGTIGEHGGGGGGGGGAGGCDFGTDAFGGGGGGGGAGGQRAGSGGIGGEGGGGSFGVFAIDTSVSAASVEIVLANGGDGGAGGDGGLGQPGGFGGNGGMAAGNGQAPGDGGDGGRGGHSGGGGGGAGGPSVGVYVDGGSFADVGVSYSSGAGGAGGAGGVGGNPATTGGTGASGVRQDSIVVARGGAGDAAQRLAERLAARGASCDAAPCVDGGGECPPADLNMDGAVDSADLAILLAAWGACP